MELLSDNANAIMLQTFLNQTIECLACKSALLNKESRQYIRTALLNFYRLMARGLLAHLAPVTSRQQPVVTGAGFAKEWCQIGKDAASNR